jgi:serine/threonine protein kinase
MAPEMCMPPPEPSSRESDVWSYGCVVLETTSGREPWITQFSDDMDLFRALQRRENASVFARICANEFGPSHIHELLIRCCSWSKVNRPSFVHILNSLDATHNNDAFISNTIEPMLLDLPPYDSELNAEESKYDGSQRLDPPLPIETTRNNSKANFSKLNGYRGRLTGEIYTSTGSASGRPIYEGLKGGRYYLTENGSKIYLHK